MSNIVILSAHQWEAFDRASQSSLGSGEEYTLHDAKRAAEQAAVGEGRSDMFVYLPDGTEIYRTGDDEQWRYSVSDEPA